MLPYISLGSRLTSPRGSISSLPKSRKRALSHSPFSDVGGLLDIEQLTRSSEGSLQLPTPFGPSRSSSAASGSYGHLSAASLAAISPSPGLLRGQLPNLPGVTSPAALAAAMMQHPGFLPRQAAAVHAQQVSQHAVPVKPEVRKNMWNLKNN